MIYFFILDNIIFLKNNFLWIYLDMICNVFGDIVFFMDGSDSISDVDFMC